MYLNIGGMQRENGFFKKVIVKMKICLFEMKTVSPSLN